MAHLLHGPKFARRKERLLARATGRVLELDPASLQATHDDTYDTIVIVHTLCAVPDIDAALGRVDELLAPGGRLLVLEHVRIPGARGIVQDMSAPIWSHAPVGCHPNRDVIGALRRHGFAVTDCDRFRESRALPIVAAHISAVAIRKARPAVKETTE